MRISLFTTVAAAGALAVAVISPAVANAAETDLTFTVVGGALTITAPQSAPLTVTGNVASGGIDPVTVSDQRAGINGWIVQASSSAFAKSAQDDTEIPATAVSYSAPLLPTRTGISTVSGVLVPQVIDTNKPVVTAVAVVGANTATWTGTVTVTLPSEVVAGDYAGTVTHSFV